MTKSPSTHVSVLLEEFLKFFSDLELSVFVDGTVGAGGHAAKLLKAHPEIKRFVGIDRDPEALGIASEELFPWKEKVQLIHGSFGEMKTHLSRLKVDQIDGCLLDLGVSSMQLDRPEKGFSFLVDGPLDMRMDPDQELTAEKIVNSYSEKELGRILLEYGEERRWKHIAAEIVRGRQKKRLSTTGDLCELLLPILGRVRGKLHPLTLVFQALRIAVNGELEAMEQGVGQALDLLKPGGRLAVISFHSLEDRFVKRLFREKAAKRIEGQIRVPVVKLLTKKPVVPQRKEYLENRRSRSAKMRIVEKL